jgi:hypothetical protein
MSPVATKAEIDAIKRKLAKQSAEESRTGPNWAKLAKKSNKGMRKSNAGKKKQDAMGKRLPGAGWTKNA